MADSATVPAPTRLVDTVIFDLGGVLAANGRQSDFAARFPAEVAETVKRIFMGPYHEDTDHPWHRLERGEIPMDEMRRLNALALAEAGIQLPPMPASDPESGRAAAAFSFEPNVPVIALVERLRAEGIRLGVLTNNVAEFRPLWTTMMDFDALFDDVVDSSAVGLRKPNPAIYHLALERLGASASTTAFLDDVQSNVDAAVAVGMVGVFVDVDPTAAVDQVLSLTGLSD